MNLKVEINKFSFDTDIIFSEQKVTINSRNMTAIVGENGVGKSTLVNIINGDLEADMKLIYNNEAIIPGYNDYVSFIPDTFIGLEYLTPLEAVEYFLALYNKKFDEQRFKELLVTANIEEKFVYKDIIKNLSKGTKQKVVFIIYMMIEAKVIIFDEGLENIDEFSLNRIMAKLKEWTLEDRICLIATHSKLILQYTDQCLKLIKSDDGAKLQIESKVTL